MDEIFSEIRPKVIFQTILEKAYENFNRREIEKVLTTMNSNVVWPNGMEGGVVLGHSGVRDYWTRQWNEINPHVEPLAFQELEDGNIKVTVRQIVKDLSGQLLLNQEVTHTYHFENGLIASMEIGN